MTLEVVLAAWTREEIGSEGQMGGDESAVLVLGKIPALRQQFRTVVDLIPCLTGELIDIVDVGRCDAGFIQIDSTMNELGTVEGFHDATRQVVKLSILGSLLP